MRIYECGICEAYHPWDWIGDCRENDNRLDVPQPNDEVYTWDERIQADTVNLKESLTKGVTSWTTDS